MLQLKNFRIVSFLWDHGVKEADEEEFGLDYIQRLPIPL
jgi:hypothetical protein